ncbi:MAG TPA: Gfo/Idh/MocA family oxidoreductase [Chloroflexota bacterium]|jgi:predicted dehydrogenase|nr:Gfo/Idh/MocA family oxidoreductase [Chloroflexota bacterium]
MFRLGIVDCDTSHVVAFTSRLNHVGVGEEQWVDGATVTMAVPGTSLLSPERIPGFVEKLRGWGVQIVDAPADLIGKVDGVLIESVDGSVHLERALPFLQAGVPTYVDKPFTCSVADARQLLSAARAKGLPLFSASAMRYASEVQEVLHRREELGAVVGVDAYSVASLHPRNPGWFHYGVHGVEPMYQLMGPGCAVVRSIATEGTHVATGRWKDGRMATVRGIRQGAHAFGFTAFCEKDVVRAAIDAGPVYRALLQRIVAMFQTGTSPLTPEELLEPVAFQEAANASAERGGDEVRLATA